jgi:hypothetical protein
VESAGICRLIINTKSAVPATDAGTEGRMPDRRMGIAAAPLAGGATGSSTVCVTR